MPMTKSTVLRHRQGCSLGSLVPMEQLFPLLAILHPPFCLLYYGEAWTKSMGKDKILFRQVPMHREHCSCVLSMSLRFVLWKKWKFAHIYKFSLNTKNKTVDKILGCSTFPEGIQGRMQELGESELKQHKAVWKDLLSALQFCSPWGTGAAARYIVVSWTRM